MYQLLNPKEVFNKKYRLANEHLTNRLTINIYICVRSTSQCIFRYLGFMIRNDLKIEIVITLKGTEICARLECTCSSLITENSERH